MERPPPGWVIKIAVFLTDFLHWLADAITPPAGVLMNKLTAFVGSAAIYEAAVLGITENVGKTSKDEISVAELATKLGVHERNLLRLLRGLYQNGLYQLRETNGRVFVRNNALSMTLHPDLQPSMKNMALHQGADVMPVICDSEGGIDYSIKKTLGSETTAFYRKYGMVPWTWIEKNPDRSLIINKAMQAVDTMGVGAMVMDHNWGQYNRVLDIGGGTGHFLFNILQTYDTIKQGLVCDLPGPIEDGKKQFAEQCKLDYKGNSVSSPLAALKPRVEFQTIDLFKKETLPRAKDGDCFMLRAVFHDFVEKDVQQILPNLRAAIGNARAHLVIVEMIPENDSKDSMQGLISTVDLVMLSLNGGGERTPTEWSRLFAESGFKLKFCNKTRSPFSIILAEAA